MEFKYKTILVPIDFSDFSKSALKYAVTFAQHYHSKLILIYVMEPVIYPPDFSMGQITLPTINFEVDKRAKEELEKLAAAEIGTLVQVETVLKTGKPFVEIIETAKEVDADLIIISTHGHSGVEHMLFGSTADKVVQKAPCPVLTLREPIKGFDYKEMIKK